MATLPKPQTLHRDAYRRVFADGLWDMALGLLFLNALSGSLIARWGVPPTWQVGLTIAVMLAILWGTKAAKLAITAPRMGTFRVEAARRKPLRPVLMISAAITVGLVLFTMAGRGGAFPKGIPTVMVILGVLALKFIVLFSLAAWYFGVGRFYLYGWLVGWSFIGTEYLLNTTQLTRGTSQLLSFVLCCSLMVVIGAVLLMRFLARYPAIKDSEPS